MQLEDRRVGLNHVGLHAVERRVDEHFFGEPGKLFFELEGKPDVLRAFLRRGQVRRGVVQRQTSGLGVLVCRLGVNVLEVRSAQMRAPEERFRGGRQIDLTVLDHDGPKPVAGELNLRFHGAKRQIERRVRIILRSQEIGNLFRGAEQVPAQPGAHRSADEAVQLKFAVPAVAEFGEEDAIEFRTLRGQVLQLRQRIGNALEPDRFHKRLPARRDRVIDGFAQHRIEILRGAVEEKRPFAHQTQLEFFVGEIEPIDTDALAERTLDCRAWPGTAERRPARRSAGSSARSDADSSFVSWRSGRCRARP